jgi:glycerol uptake facilitator-like aquaporin
MNFSKVNPLAVMAELVGTCLLALAVLVSIGGYVPWAPTPVVAGVSLGLIVLLIGGISGAHVNPAVTLGMRSLNKLDNASTISYIVAQFVGAGAAWVLITLLLDGEAVPQVASADVSSTVWIAEIIGTFFFTLGIAATVNAKHEGAGTAMGVGLSLLTGISFAAVASNGGLNPAVATAIGSGTVAYLVGPIIGSVLGMNFFVHTMTKKKKLN